MPEGPAVDAEGIDVNMVSGIVAAEKVDATEGTMVEEITVVEVPLPLPLT